MPTPEELVNQYYGENGEPEEQENLSTGEVCVPHGAAIRDVKPYRYVVQQEDLGSVWRIPEKFNLPVKKGDAWRWHELRQANLDWPGGFATVYGACNFQGLFPGATLKIPGSWPAPKPGVETKKDDRTPSGLPDSYSKTALIVGAVGLVTIGGLTWVAWRDRR